MHLIPAARKIRQSSRDWWTAAFLSPLFLGMAPVLGKSAIASGSEAFTVAALRTVVAAAILWLVYLLFARRYLFIFPVGLLSCIIVGAVNGIGSLMYYGGLAALNSASVVQLLNSTYVIFVMILARFSGQPFSRRTVARVVLVMVGIVMLTGGFQGNTSWLGVGLMIGNAILFAGTVTLSQRGLYEMPAPTMTIYTLTSMAAVVMIARLVFPTHWMQGLGPALPSIAVLGITTALSRLTLFAGVKQIGSIQTVLLGTLETAVALILSFVFLGERFTPMQVAAMGVLLTSLLLARPGDLRRRHTQSIPILSTSLLFQNGIIWPWQRRAIRQALVTTRSLRPSKRDVGIHEVVTIKEHEDAV
jgi:drug/metabolite transporter (DMT)-like permease